MNEGLIEGFNSAQIKDETLNRIDAAGCIDDFILQFYGAHLLWFVHDHAQIKAKPL